MLNDKLEWTQQLGYAVAHQQAAVLDSIQRLRRQAQKAGSLKTTGQQRIVVQEEIVVIEPADPQTVYVPVYHRLTCTVSASYGASGIMSFTINQDGVVFQKDLGPRSKAIASTMKLFDPDLTWAQVEVVN